MAEKKLRYTRSLSICDFDNIINRGVGKKCHVNHKAKTENMLPQDEFISEESLNLVEKRFSSLDHFLKTVIVKTQNHFSTRKVNFPFRILVKTTIVNFKKEEMIIDVMIKTGEILGEPCFILVCYNRLF